MVQTRSTSQGLVFFYEEGEPDPPDYSNFNSVIHTSLIPDLEEFMHADTAGRVKNKSGNDEIEKSVTGEGHGQDVIDEVNSPNPKPQKTDSSKLKTGLSGKISKANKRKVVKNPLQNKKDNINLVRNTKGLLSGTGSKKGTAEGDEEDPPKTEDEKLAQYEIMKQKLDRVCADLETAGTTVGFEEKKVLVAYMGLYRVMDNDIAEALLFGYHRGYNNYLKTFESNMKKLIDSLGVTDKSLSRSVNDLKTQTDKMRGSVVPAVKPATVKFETTENPKKVSAVANPKIDAKKPMHVTSALIKKTVTSMSGESSLSQEAELVSKWVKGPLNDNNCKDRVNKLFKILALDPEVCALPYTDEEDMYVSYGAALLSDDGVRLLKKFIDGNLRTEEFKKKLSELAEEMKAEFQEVEEGEEAEGDEEGANMEED